MALVLVGLVAAFAGLRPWEPDGGDLMPAIRGEVGMAASRVRQTATRDGVVDWRLDAAGARVMDNGGAAVVEAPEVVFFMKNQGDVRLTAREGTVKTATNDIRVAGNVVMRDPAYRLETEALRYLHADRRLVSESPVTLSGQGMSLQADHLELDLDAGRAVFTGRVKGTFGDGFRL
jgi:LPS export ABC transporter protein LptC